MRLRVVLKVSALFVAISVSARAGEGVSGVADAPRPLWSVEAIPDLDDPGRNPPGIAFLNNEQLIVYYVGHDLSQLSSRQTPDSSSPFRLRVSVIDGASGKTLSTKEWGTRSSGSPVRVTSGGVLVRTGDLLRLCSKDLIEMDRIGLAEAPYQGWEMRVSTSGKSVLLNHYHMNRQQGISVSRFEVLDGDTLKPRLSWAQSPGIVDHYEITDRIMAAEQYENAHGAAVATEFGSAMWKPLFEVSGGVCSPGRSGIFVTESLLVCASRDFVMSSTTGKVLMTDAFAKSEGNSAKIAIAQNGSDAAVLIQNFRDIFDTGGHIVSLHAAVYDLAHKKRIMTVAISPPPKYDYGVALSPDGSKLAILSDRTVCLYPVPIPRGN